MRAINARAIGAEKANGIPSKQIPTPDNHSDTDSDPEDSDDTISPRYDPNAIPLMPAPNLVDSGENNVMGLNPDELRRKLLEYIAEPVLIQRGEDAMTPVCYLPQSRSIRSFVFAQEPDGTFVCRKCAQFHHKPEIANRIGFSSRHNLRRHL